MVRRIIETAFPSKVRRSGKNVYLTLPSAVIERMRLEDGDDLDVIVKLPET